MISQPTPANADPDRGASRTADDREPSAVRQSNDDEAAAVENAADRERAMSPARRQAIAEAAYYRAQQRGFEPGYEIEDWLAAEREIMEREGAGTVG